MFIDRPACDAFFGAYLAQLPPGHRHHTQTPDAFGFGGEPTLAEELAALVCAGQKCATTSLPIEYTALDEALPRVGDLSIVVRGNGQPAALIERTQVEHKAFDDVDAVYAAVEGEGDGSLTFWREAHRDYFQGVCRRLGGDFDGGTLVICQIFRVIWPRSQG